MLRMSRDQQIIRILDELAPVLARQKQALARHGCLRAVSTGNLHVLMVLDIGGPVPMSRLAELLDVSLPSATGIVGRMEERGLIERIRDLSDRRVVLVRLTDAGRRTVQDMELMRRQHLAQILRAMTPTDRAICLKAFRALRLTSDRLEAAGTLDPPHQDHVPCHRTSPSRTAAFPNPT